ncbi:carbohydrate binding domain-containing protein, partial [bacterium]|nr:carbohydrate binding domain-containing protein [bacterium]
MNKFKIKIISGVTLLVIFLSIFTPILFFPKTAHAQWIVTDIVAKIRRLIVWAWKTSSSVVFRNFIYNYAAQIAQQAGQYAATGGAGQKPLFLTNPKKMLSQAADEALGTFIDTMAQQSFLNRSLCEPINPMVKLKILLSIPEVKPVGPIPKERVCSLTMIRKNLAEARKKQLLDIDVKLTRGSIKNTSVQLESLISTSEKLSNYARSKLSDSHNELKDIYQRLTVISSYIKEGGGGLPSDTTVDELRSLKEEIEEQKKVIDAYITQGMTCAGLSQGEFCTYADNFCSQLCLEGCPGTNFGENCLQPVSAFTDLARQELSWAIELGNTAKSLLNVLESKTIEETQTAFKTGDDLLKDLSKVFNPASNPLGERLTLEEEAKKEKTKAEEAQETEIATEQGGYTHQKSKISGEVKVPASTVSGTTNEGFKNIFKRPQYTGNPVADLMTIFVQQFSKSFLDQLYREGLNVAQMAKNWKKYQGYTKEQLLCMITGGTNCERLGPGGTESGGRPGTTEARNIFASLAKVSLTPAGNEDILADFSSCPSPRDYALPENCVMDQGFVQAVQNKMTIAEAIEKNLLHGDWYVSGYGIKDSPDDYLSRYSLTNIKKLRLARIVPLGLQIAAEKIASGELGTEANYTLKEIVDGFNDENSHFYHLVDPNWVLKLPATRCEAKAYSAVPVPETAQRQKSCVDWKTCIHEDKNGKCDTYGYCVREKNIWRFNGDSCDKQYVTCRTYQRVKDGKKFSYLKNTLDFDNCDENNFGCQWYCQDWVDGLAANGQGIWACTEPGKSLRKTAEGNYYTIDKSDNAIYFNAKVEKCSADSEGCHQFIRTKENLGTNLVPNSDFENYRIDEEGNLSVKGWTANDNAQFILNETKAFSEKIVAELESNGYVYLNDDAPDIYLLKNHYYTFSAWVKNEDENNSHSLSLYYGDSSSGTGIEIEGSKQTIPEDSDWQRISYTYKISENLTIKNFYWKADGGPIYIDNIQIEEGKKLSNYSNYGSKNLIYLKKAPDWMNCYDGDGDFSNNNLDCYNYALECTSNDVGCDIYTPTNGEPPVPGVVYETDYCPAECVGYQLFKEMPTYFDSGQDNVDLIPDTAKTCPASEVGCSEFTNLDLVLQGGEGLEYYTYLRQCVKTNENNQPIDPQPFTHEENVTCKYYYTWVGSETTGYQLKRYYLKSNANGSPAITNESEGICSESDMATNPHCKQFYDKDGNVYYAIYEYTITCSPDCHPYRKTISNETDCLASGGTWKNNNCYYLAIPSQGRKCSAANVNCHEYKGSAANNVRQIIFDDFETDEQLEKWTGGTISSESIYFGGHSFQSSGTSLSRDVSGLISQEKSYLLSFWAKGSGTYSVKFKGKDEDDNVIEISFGSVSVSSDEWQEIKIGPIYIPVGETISSLVISGSSEFYLDNVSLKEVSQDLYLIKGSWEIPETCTIDDIGCQAYKNSIGELYYLKSFDHLCSEDKVGCEVLIDTQNSSSPFAQEFNTENTNENDDIKVSKDEIIYLVNNKNKSCRPEDKGCQKFGLPKITDGSITAWTDVYFKNDPDKYNLKPTICQADDLGCEAYVDLGSGSPVYFKDPKDKLCEWRDNVILPGNAEQTISGWFKKGTDQPCYYNEDGTAHYGIYQSTEEFYDGSVGLCPTEQSGCKVFAEPGATEGDNLIKNGDFSAGED